MRPLLIHFRITEADFTVLNVRINLPDLFGGTARVLRARLEGDL
jgi:hypothetical protein